MQAALRYSRFVVWIGPSLVAMGVSSGAVSGQWGAIPLALIGVGAFVTVFYLTLLVIASPRFWQRRSTQAGANAVVATMAMLLILGLVNVLGTRYVSRLDLTENQLFTLSPQTQAVVKTLDQPTKVWVFLPPGDPLAVNSRTLLTQYQQLNPQFSFEIVDPQEKPTIAKQFGVTSLGEVYLEAKGQRQQVQRITQFDRLAEGRLTNRLELLASGESLTVYFTQGHGESSLDRTATGISSLNTLLLDKRIQGETLNLANTGTIPENAATVIIAGIQRPLLEAEVKAITTYSDRGGSLMLLLDPKVTTGLEPFLEKTWGVKLDDRLVINASQQQLLGPSTPVISQYGAHPITESFGNGFSAYPFARPIALIPTDKVQQVPLLITDDQNWAESDLENPNVSFDASQGDIKGPLTLGAALTHPIQPAPPAAVPSPSPTASPSAQPDPASEAAPSPDSPSPQGDAAAPTPDPADGQPPASPSPKDTPASTTPTPGAKEPLEARLVVIGNAQFAENQFSQRPQLLNSDLFLNAVTWLTKQDDRSLSIRPKEVTSRGLSLTSLQANLIGWTALVILPLIGFGTAAAIWWQRR